MISFIKFKTKLIYKKFIIYFFLAIYKKPLYKKNKQLKKFKAFKFHIREKIYKIFELENGRVFTDRNDTTAYITEENFLTEGSLQFKKFDQINSKNQPIEKNITLKNGTTNFKKKINGNVLSLLSGGASRNNFTHWFTDVIPRIILFSKKFNLNVIDIFYVPSIKHNYQVESLKLLKIPLKKIISSEYTKHIEAKKIFYTSHPCHYYTTKAQKWLFESLRNIYLQKKIKKNIKYKYIFIDRDQFKLIDKSNLKKYSSWRVLLNENEIKSFLKSKGFKIIKPEELSFIKQIEIFNSAEVIISLFGAAMMMVAFCNKKAKIIEIKPNKAGNDFKNISDKLNLKHEQINLKPKFRSSTSQNGLLFCDLNLIKKKINKLNIKI